MNYKKAVGAGLLVFAIQFSLVNVLGNLIGPFLGTGQAYVYGWQAFMILVLVTIVYFVSKWYFTGNKVTLNNGLYLGAILVATNVVITLVQAVPAAILGQSVTSAIVTYLTGWPFILTAVITVAAATGTAYLNRKISADCNVKDAISASMPKDSDTEADCEECKNGTCSTH